MQTTHPILAPAAATFDVTKGFTVQPSAYSNRLLELRFPKETVNAFLDATAEWPIQALEYKSFLRFQCGKVLDDICHGTLRPAIITTLTQRETGGLLVIPEGLTDVSQADDMVKFSTAVAHLLGRSNFDAMSGKYYARFVVENVDSSDSYLRQPYRVMELHNDGTYVDEITDYVLMMKIDEQNMEGGNSLLLHLDDWQELEKFYTHPLARHPMRWAAPPSKNTSKDVFHPVFGSDAIGQPTMRYIDQFVQPENYEQGLWLFELGESLENSPQKVSVPVQTGSFLLINNMVWLHGRDRFTAHPGLRRELMRQRGYFSIPRTVHYNGQ